jgi:hypothetical protein
MDRYLKKETSFNESVITDNKDGVAKSNDAYDFFKVNAKIMN